MFNRNKVNKSLVKAISVVTSFTPDDMELSMSDISRKTRLPMTTVYRIVATLTQGGLLERIMKSNKYRIGPEFYILGSLYLRGTDILSAAEPVTKTLNDLTGEAVAVSILNQGNVILVLKEESKHDFRVATHAGSILVAYASAMGKVLLSELTEAEVDSILPNEELKPMTKNTVATKSELKRELEQLRKTGLSLDMEGNYEGLIGIASVVRDSNGRAVAAMSIGLPTFRVDQAITDRVSTLVKMGTQLISYRLGYRNTVNPVYDIEEIRSWWERKQLNSTPEVTRNGG